MAKTTHGPITVNKDGIKIEGDEHGNIVIDGPMIAIGDGASAAAGGIAIGAGASAGTKPAGEGSLAKTVLDGGVKVASAVAGAVAGAVVKKHIG